MSRLVGITGGTGSGKTSIAAEIDRMIPNSTILNLDNCYKSLGPKQLELADKNEYDFDHPNAFDWETLRNILMSLKAGKVTKIPIYEHSVHQVTRSTELEPSPWIIIEGIHTFWDPEVRELLDYKVFVDVDADTRLARRIRRDIALRSRTVDSVLDQYEKYVKPAYDKFIEPMKAHADVIVPRGKENALAIQMIVDTLNKKK